MNLNRYRNELIVLVSFILMLSAFFYKNSQIDKQAQQLFEMKHSVKDFKEIIALKRIWGDKGLSKKIDKLKSIVPVSKVSWSKKGKKLTAHYSNLTPKELNKLVTRAMNLAVQIISFKITRSGDTFNVEFKCKW